MKKGKYQIMVSKKGEIGILTVDGWLIDDTESELKFGARYYFGSWEITELSTGLLITDGSAAHTVNNKNLIPQYIAKMRGVIINILEHNPKMVNKFESLKSTLANDEN